MLFEWFASGGLLGLLIALPVFVAFVAVSVGLAVAGVTAAIALFRSLNRSTPRQ